MSSSTTSISQLLSRPLGPYPVFELLQDRKSLPGRSFPLQSVKLTYRGQVVGLDTIGELDRSKACIYFKGVLNIKQARWLSEEGSKVLQRDFQRRTGSKDLDYWIRNSNVNVLVKISGELYATPWLDDDGVFHIHSHKRGPNVEYVFSIKSMHVSCYALSKCCMSRDRTWHLIKTIVNQNKSTPMRRRTPKWLVGRYLNENYQRFKERTLDRTHTARTIHRSEVYSLFAKHAGWLLKAIKRKDCLDVGSWNDFCREIELQKRVGGIIDCNKLEQLWPDTVETAEIDHQTNDEIRQESMSPPLDEHWVARPSSRLTNSDIFTEVPINIFLQPPEFPSNYEWRCPDEKCHYTINFRNLSEENVGTMSRDDRAFLKSLRWNPYQGRLIELFNDMVEDHFYKHLTKLGVKVVASRKIGQTALGEPIVEDVCITGSRQLTEETTDVGFEWVKPAHHATAPR